MPGMPKLLEWFFSSWFEAGLYCGKPGLLEERVECQYDTSKNNSEELHTFTPRWVYRTLQAGGAGTVEGREGANTKRHGGLVA